VPRLLTMWGGRPMGASQVFYGLVAIEKEGEENLSIDNISTQILTMYSIRRCVCVCVRRRQHRFRLVCPSLTEAVCSNVL